MSAKRQAPNELTHENWDQDDPADHEEAGSYKIAAKEILEKRVIRTAKRRSQLTGDEPKKSAFSGFGGFNKTQPSSFDFLSKLTNGSNDNNSLTSKADPPAISSLFSSKPPASSPGTGLFSLQSNTATPTKSPFGSPSQAVASSLFGVSSTNTATGSNIFVTSKADSTVGESAFKIQTVTSSTDSKTDSTKLTTTTSMLTSTKFDIPTTSANLAKSLFSVNSTPSPIANQPVTNTVQSNFGTITKSESSGNDSKNPEETKHESKMKYYSKLKGLNESVSDWIKKHVEKTPLCILSPIFKDYEKYLKEMQDEYNGSNKNKKDDDKTATAETKTDLRSMNKTVSSPIQAIGTSTSTNLFNASATSKSLLAPQNNSTAAAEKPATFSFGINPSTTVKTPSKNPPPSSGFSFGVASSSSQSTTSTPFGTTTSPPFSFAANTSTTTTNGSAASFCFGTGKPFNFINVKHNSETTVEENKQEEKDTPPKVEYNIPSKNSAPSSGFSFGVASSSSQSTTSTPFGTTTSTPFSFAANTSTTTTNGSAASFSFGIGKPFSFNNVKPNSETTVEENKQEEEDTPPKVEYTPIVEDNSVYDKKCKIFVKKDGNFVDKGVGTLYIKKIEESGKHQLLVRANTNLGTILINLILMSAIPTQRMGKNNVMMVCIPTPDSKPPPTPILIRVKTTDEADELLATLDKYKT